MARRALVLATVLVLVVGVVRAVGGAPRGEFSQGTPKVGSPAAASALPTATPKEGDVLYVADWSNGLNGWTGTTDWTTLNGMLVNDGTGNGRSLFAPYFPDSVEDYAVETQIQYVRSGGKQNRCPEIDIVVRATDQGDIATGIVTNANSCKPNLRGDIGQYVLQYSNANKTSYQVVWLASTAFALDNDWHTYRMEVRGNTITTYVDGKRVLVSQDNRFLGPGKVGMVAGNIQINVRSFKVIALGSGTGSTGAVTEAQPSDAASVGTEGPTAAIVPKGDNGNGSG